MTVKDEQALIDQWIVPDPHRGTSEARIAEYGVPVWAIIGYLRAAGDDVDRTAQDYEIEREAVEAARAYYARHRYQIDARLEDNENLIA